MVKIPTNKSIGLVKIYRPYSWFGIHKIIVGPDSWPLKFWREITGNFYLKPQLSSALKFAGIFASIGGRYGLGAPADFLLILRSSKENSLGILNT